MTKKYQVFISSTFEDLKEERKKVIETILAMNQFPAGMELFSAADEEQWEVIQETIDTSDYYVLIMGRCYGSLIEDGPDKGISYTEKEFNYALEQKVPILAFIMSDTAAVSGLKFENDLEKIAALNEFRKKVKKGRLVKFWSNPDELATQLSQALFKAMSRDNRPGWVRTTEFDVEKSYAEIVRLTERVHVLEALNADLKLENDRKPDLHLHIKADEPFSDEDERLYEKEIRVKNGENGATKEIYFTTYPVYMNDVKEGLTYKDGFGREVNVDAEDVKMYRFVFKNGFPLLFRVCNDGNARATGVRVHISFPDDLVVMAFSDLHELIREDIIFSRDAYENRDSKFFEPEDIDTSGTMTEKSEKFISIDNLINNDEIANLLDPAEGNEALSIFPGEVEFDTNEVRHLDTEWFRGIYILPLKAGEFHLECEILCNELAGKTKQIIKVVVD